MPPFIHPDGRLMIYAKAPVPGRVKTRLHDRLAPAQCAALQEQLIGHTLRMASTSRVCPVELDIAGGQDHPAVRRLANEYGVAVHEQTGGDLGARMLHSLKRALKTSNFALITGCDCPAVTADTLSAACRALTDKPVVLAPAEDGGYGLIGSRVADPAVFESVDWSSDRVLEQTRRNLHAAGLDWAELDTVWDVDRPEDLDRLFALAEFTHWKTEGL